MSKDTIALTSKGIRGPKGELERHVEGYGLEVGIAHGRALCNSGAVASDEFPVGSCHNFVATVHRATTSAHGKVDGLELADGGDEKAAGRHFLMHS